VIADVVNDGLRRLILAASESVALRGLVRTHGMRFGAGRFVAGESFDQAVPVLRRLNDRGLLTNTTMLGEGVRDDAETKVVVEEYERVLERIEAEGLRTNLALKPTHLGLSLSEQLAYDNIARLARHAAARDAFVRLDMEESQHVDATLRIYRRLRSDGIDNVGIVLQSSMLSFRSA
jgi:proline dehydrogenase